MYNDYAINDSLEWHRLKLTLKSDSEAIKSSNSFVADDALCAGDVLLNELCDRAVN